jgi:hypothetical protein
VNADVHTSVTRIADLERRPYRVEPRPLDEWGTGDYVFVRVTKRPDPDVTVENPRGRRVKLMEGETVVGALGTRRATRELVGDWRDVDDGDLNVMTGGGVLGRVTSTSPFGRPPVDVEYEGHVVADGDVVRMADHGLTADAVPHETPVVVVLGTSMSTGKTMSARVLVRVLVEEGYRVAACKLTGAGTYGDVLSMEVAGAAPIYDFVDAGLPTTVVPEGTYREAIEPVLDRLQGADVILAEIGASPLEPYNGMAALDLLADRVAFTVLCASDPYAVVGIEEACGCSPDLVTGIATNTTAGIDLLDQLTDCSALDLQKEEAKEPLGDLLVDALPV